MGLRARECRIVLMCLVGEMHLNEGFKKKKKKK